MTPIEAVQAMVDALFLAHPMAAVTGTDKQEQFIWAALERGRTLLAQIPLPPPERQSEAEKTAFAFGWWKAQETASAERDELRALWLEWEEGMYDGPDLLRRVRLALHRKDGLRAVNPARPTLTDEWFDEAMRLIGEFGRSMKHLLQGVGYNKDADSKLDAVRAHLSKVLAASAAPAPEQMQPNAQDKGHLALPRAGSVCGVNAAEAARVNAPDGGQS